MFKGKPGEVYRPANGTEGMIFMAHFCERCSEDNFNDDEDTGGCEIMARSMAFGEKDPNYPKEWTYDKDGLPICAAFSERKT